jgi:hypothetical protein
MTCEDVRRFIPLLQYGEISFDEEESVHAHLAACTACADEMQREQTIHRALDHRELDPSAFFLRNCRDQLAGAIEAERAQAPRYATWWQGVTAAFSGSAFSFSFVRPVGALALIALGFLGARMMPLGGPLGIQSAGLVDPANARVRFVEAGPRGGVQLVVDETRQRVISGRLDDSHIRALLLSAAKDPNDPGLRGESMEILKSRTESDEIRNALIYALQHDANDGVRLKALEGLKPYAAAADVRKALSQVLLTDANPGLRVQAVDLLVQNPNEGHIIGVLQELMVREDNPYIRLQSEKALRQMKASIETY